MCRVKIWSALYFSRPCFRLVHAVHEAAPQVAGVGEDNFCLRDEGLEELLHVEFRQLLPFDALVGADIEDAGVVLYGTQP